MAYERVNWENLPSTKTPVNADNLNKMDEGIKDLETELSKKANSSDVYTKEQLDNNLLPMTMLKGIYIGDHDTVKFQVGRNGDYLLINSHIIAREIVLITQQTVTPEASALHIDRILSSSTNPVFQTSFSFQDGKITITGAENCRGRVYKLNYQVSG